MMRTCDLLAVGLDAGRAEPVMLLQETDAPRRVLPIWIGLPEAAALEIHRSRRRAERPSTHQLLADLVAAFGRRIERTQITALDGSVFVGELVFDEGLTVSARPSDAVTLAVALQVPVLVADDVLDAAAIDPALVIGSVPEADAPDPQAVEQEITEFRRVLDDVDPEDFDTS